MSVVYRERDRERFDDSKTTVSARTSGGTKVTRYVVKEDDSRSDYDRKSRYDDGRQSRYDDTRSRYDDRRTDYDRGDTKFEETKIIRTTRDEEEPRQARAYSTVDPGYSKSRETITIRRDETSPDRRDEYWRRPAGEPVEERELVIRRTVDRDNNDRGPSRADDRQQSLALSRVDDRRYSDYEMVAPQRQQFDDHEREVSRYIRNTEYYQPQAPQQPQTIIIRQEPIIIRETVRNRSRSRSRDRREEDFQIVKKSDIDERSVARRSEPRDEEYFYEKKIREPIRDDRDDRKSRREVSPGDSISQVGRRGRDRGYESDDSMVYVRKETREDFGSDSDDHRGRDLAAGAVAGLGAAELFCRHNQKEGKDVSQGGGRLARGVGAGLVGAVAAEGIRRYRSKSRKRGSRSRSGSRERGGRRRGERSRSRSRSGSNTNIKNLGGLGLAAAAVAAGAFLANRNKNKNASPEGRRSRSRRRSQSRASSRASSRESLENDSTADDDRNPKNRNKKTAAAGVVGAAAMALYERHRSKSRGRASSGSPNRLKQGAPIVGAGLAAAGLAHLFEKRKARDEANDIIKDEKRRSRSRGSRSRSRGNRTESIYQDGPSQAPRGAYSDPNLIQYGTEPLYGNNFGQGYYGRPHVEQDYYNNNTRDIVPAPAPPPATSSFDATSRRPRSASRTRSLSSGSSGRHRSRSRGAAAAAAAVGAGVAASELQNRNRDKKERKRRSRDRQRSRRNSNTPDQRSRTDSYAPYTAGRDPYEDANWHATHSASYAQGMNDPYASQSGFGQFPPPPGSMPHQGYAPQQAPQYAPQDFPPPPAGGPQAQAYNDPYAPGQNPYAPRNRGADENVNLAMSPPTNGPDVTIQRPSTSTPVGQPAPTRFPGSTVNPFAQTVHDATTLPTSGDSSPGTRPSDRSPKPPGSRAAMTYTPTPPPIGHFEHDRRLSAEPAPQLRTVPVITDAPTPLPQPRPQPEDPRVTAFRNAAHRAPPNPNSAQAKQPEMQETKRGKTPFMPSPDIRPPSDDALPFQQQHYRPFMNGDDNAPSMPSLFVPERSFPARAPSPLSAASTYMPPAPPPDEERRARERSRSQSQSRSRGGPLDGDVTPRARSPSQGPKKSVSFAPKPEFSDAPSIIPGDKVLFSSEADSADVQRRQKREREGDRDRDGRHRQRSKERRGYDAGDDFSDDTPFEDHRRRSHDRGSDRERDRGTRHGSRRERSDPQSLDHESTRDGDVYRDPKRSNTFGSSSSSSRKDRRRDGSPGSDTTVDLPPRFDDKGRKKPASHVDSERSPDEDVLAEKLDEILGGLFGGNKKKRL